MWRRSFLWRLLPAHLLPALVVGRPQDAPGKSKILIKSAWGSADPTQATFPFHHANAFAEAGHPVQIFLLGEAVSLMRTVVANSVVPVGWPRVSELLAKVVERKIPIYACGTCSRARGVTEADLANWGAEYGSPPIFVSLVEWADRIIVE